MASYLLILADDIVLHVAHWADLTHQQHKIPSMVALPSLRNRTAANGKTSLFGRNCASLVGPGILRPKEA